MIRTICFALIFCSSVYANRSELENCLIEDWGVDHHTAVFIRNKLEPLSDELLDEFIEKSKKIKIDFSPEKELKTLLLEDGIYQAPEEHLIVFENPYVRILYGSTKPKKREPFHLHNWKSIYVIIKPTTYEIEYQNGTKEVGEWPIGVYELPPGEYYACTNLGENADEGLRFEIKE